MNVLDELCADGRISGKPMQIDMEAERVRRIKEVGDYNAELLSRERSPERCVVPMNFVVSMRRDNIVYDFSNFPPRDYECPLDKFEGVSFYRPLDVSRGDILLTYVLFGKFEEMRAEGGLAYITNKEPIPVPCLGSKESLPRVLVGRMPEKIEPALAISLRQNDRVTSIDSDWKLIDKYGPSLRGYFEELNSELIEEARWKSREIKEVGGFWQKFRRAR